MAFLDKIFGKKKKPEMERLELPPLPPLKRQAVELPRYQPRSLELPEIRPEPRMPTSRIEIKKTMPADITIPTGPPRVEPSRIRFPYEMHKPEPKMFGGFKPVLKKPSFPSFVQPRSITPSPAPIAPRFEGQKEEKQLKERYLPVKRTLFIDVNNFNSVISNINYIKGKLKESDDALVKLNDTKLSEDKAFEKWRTQMEDVQRKLLYIDKALFEK